MGGCPCGASSARTHSGSRFFIDTSRAGSSILPLYSTHAPVDRRGAGRTERGRPRWLAPVRLSRIEPDRAASDRTGQRGQDDDPALVLRHSCAGRTQKTGARDRAVQPRPSAGEQDDLLAAAVARVGPAAGARRPQARRDGIFARQQHSVHLARGRRHGRGGAAAGVRRGVVRRSRPAGRSRLGPRRASDALYRVKDHAFDFIRTARRDRRALTEMDVQNAMVGWFKDEGLVTDAPPVVGAQEDAGNPHYMPTPAKHRAIGDDEVVLLDLWGKLPAPGAVFADITWVGFTATGGTVPDKYARAFNAARDARDAAVALVQRAVRDGRELRGFEVDRACRAVIEQAGFGAQFIHRTGHSLGTEVHGNGVHMDDYETHDERRLIPGTGFTIEPGVYTKEFGVRTEINMVIGEHEATVSGPLQTEFVPL